MIKYIQFFPTLRCNKNCQFCFSKTFRGEDFPIEKIEVLIDFMHQNSIPSLDILGGEPFLYRALNKIVEKALEKDIEVTISTNGTFEEDLAKFLRKFSNDKVKMGVSINDLPSESLLEIIKEHKLWIKSVILKEHMPEKSILEFAKTAGIKYYLIYLDALSERDLKNAIPFYEFVDIVKKFKDLYINIEPVFCKGFIGGDKDYRCPAGSEKITLMPDGSVYPCYLLAKVKEFCLGNIFEQPFEILINSEKLDFFRKFEGNLCRYTECKIYNECRGGCPAHGFIHKGYLLAFEPRCVKDDKI